MEEAEYDGQEATPSSNIRILDYSSLFQYHHDYHGPDFDNNIIEKYGEDTYFPMSKHAYRPCFTSRDPRPKRYTKTSHRPLAKANNMTVDKLSSLTEKM